MSGTLKPGGRALIVSKGDTINTGREVITLAPRTCTCGVSGWIVQPASGAPLVVPVFGFPFLAHKASYHNDELMPLDGDPDEVGDVDAKKPEDITV